MSDTDTSDRYRCPSCSGELSGLYEMAYRICEGCSKRFTREEIRANPSRFGRSLHTESDR